MLFMIPSWDWLDLTEAFDFLFEWLRQVWVWSGSCGFVMYETYVYWRDMVIAGLVVALMVKHLLGDYEDDYEEAYEAYEGHFSRRWDSFDD